MAEVILKFDLIGMVPETVIVPMLSVIEIQFFREEWRSPRAHAPETEHPATVNAAEVQHFAVQQIPFRGSTVPFYFHLANACWTVFPCGVEVAALTIIGEWDKCVVVWFLADKKLIAIISSINATCDTTFGKGIPALQDHLVRPVRGSYSVPDVVLTAGSVKLGDRFSEVVPINTIDDPNGCLVIGLIRMHGVDKEMAVCINMHASYFRIGGHHHDTRHQFRRCFLATLGRHEW